MARGNERTRLITAMATALLLAVLPGLRPAAAQNAPAALPEDPVAQQERIYRSRGKDVPEGYVINRALDAYSLALPDGFLRTLATLGPDDRWLDIGAGEGRAILEYYSPGYDASLPPDAPRLGKARVVAISIEDRRTAQWHELAARLEPGRIRYLYGKALRDYRREDLERFQLITDVIGGFSYSRDLSLYMSGALDLLEVNGTFYTLLQDVHSEEGWNPPHYEGSPYLTEIQRADGSKMKICEWLKRITCVAVACELTTRMRPPVELYAIRKQCDEVQVPALVPVHYEAGTPPERRYVLRPAP